MNANTKIKVLLIASILIVGTLSLIQFYLVKNTYQLTKDKYYAEVTKGMASITNAPATAGLDETTLSHIKKAALKYTGKQLDRKSFLKELRAKNDSNFRIASRYFKRAINERPLLKGVRYEAQYDEIVLEANGVQDTLLADRDTPYNYIGKINHSSSTLLLSHGNTQSFENKRIKGSEKDSINISYKLRLKTSQYIDVFLWKEEVFKRMAGIFLLAAGLIVAVIVLFYLVFQAMLKQKKIADIQTDFTNNVTHELKTPLSSVSIILTSLERKEVKDNEPLFKELMQALHRQYHKLQHTVNSVLESAIATDVNLDIEDVNLTDFLNLYVSDLKLTVANLVIDINQTAIRVKTNTGALEKTLNNLVENAMKYSPAHSAIGFKAATWNDVYVIEITDQGPGISPAHQKYLFDKFYRIPEQNIHTVKGLGLGLYISKQCITQIGGNLSLKYSSEKGSAFIISLPL